MNTPFCLKKVTTNITTIAAILVLVLLYTNLAIAQSRTTLNKRLTIPAQPSETTAPASPATAIAWPVTTPPKGEIVRPAFDCNLQLNEAEQIICRTAYLSQLDQDNDTAYMQKLATISAKDPQAKIDLLAEQRLWLLWRDNCKMDEECLTRRYNNRISELSERNSPQSSTETMFSSCTYEQTIIVSKRFNAEFSRMEVTFIDGSIMWINLQGETIGGQCKNGSQITGIIKFNAQAATLPILSSGLTDWGSEVEQDLLNILSGLMPEEDFRLYHRAIDQRDYYDRIEIHFTSINFWITH